MRRIVEISFKGKNQIICRFENDETRILKLATTIKDEQMGKILSNEELFKTAKLGEFGEIYWANMGEITELDGQVKACDYDISPEFAYYNAQPLSKKNLLLPIHERN